MFEEDGSWRLDTLSSWTSPETATVQEQFLAVLEACLDRLPANAARVFMMREYLDMDFAEIGAKLRLSEGTTPLHERAASRDAGGWFFPLAATLVRAWR